MKIANYNIIMHNNSFGTHLKHHKTLTHQMLKVDEIQSGKFMVKMAYEFRPPTITMQNRVYPIRHLWPRMSLKVAY